MEFNFQLYLPDPLKLSANKPTIKTMLCNFEMHSIWFEKIDIVVSSISSNTWISIPIEFSCYPFPIVSFFSLEMFGTHLGAFVCIVTCRVRVSWIVKFIVTSAKTENGKTTINPFRTTNGWKIPFCMASACCFFSFECWFFFHLMAWRHRKPTIYIWQNRKGLVE